MLSNTEDTHVVELVSWLIELQSLDAIPNNVRRNLCDNQIKRLMSEDIIRVVDNIKNCIESVGYEFRTREAVWRRCKEEDIEIAWQPTEQDCSGWLTAVLITDKGSFYFG